MLSLANVILISCSIKQKEQNDILVSDAAFSEGFTVNVLVTAEMDDIFEMFYALDSLDEKFTESNKIRKVIKGTGEPELINFFVNRENVLKFRIDLGRNLNQEGVNIHSIEIKSKSKFLIIKGDLLKYFFNENRFMRFMNNGEIQFTPNRLKTPFMTSSALLNKKIKIEFY
jgi:hypothetical protein